MKYSKPFPSGMDSVTAKSQFRVVLLCTPSKLVNVPPPILRQESVGDETVPLLSSTVAVNKALVTAPFFIWAGGVNVITGSSLSMVVKDHVIAAVALPY